MVIDVCLANSCKDFTLCDTKIKRGDLLYGYKFETNQYLLIHERKKKLLLVSNAVLTENFNMTPIHHVAVLKGLTRILYQESDGWKNKDINTLRNILFTLDYYVKKEKPGMKMLKSDRDFYHFMEDHCIYEDDSFSFFQDLYKKYNDNYESEINYHVFCKKVTDYIDEVWDEKYILKEKREYVIGTKDIKVGLTNLKIK